MRKYKTENLELAIAVQNDGPNNKIMIAMTDDNSPMDEPQFIIKVPSVLCKSAVNDDSLAKHIINFFIKG